MQTVNLIVPEQLIIQTMNEIIELFLLPKFLELGMNATGEWRENVKGLAEPMKGIISGREYTEQLVYGRKPGKRPPIQPLERWVNAKLRIQGSQAKGIAFAIANKIAKEGTDYYPNGTDLLEVLNQPEVINYVNSKIGNYLSAQVQLEIVREAKAIFE